MIDSLLAGDNRSNMNFGRVSFRQHCLVTKFHTPSCCQHRVGDNQRFVINAGRSDIFYVYIEFLRIFIFAVSGNKRILRPVEK